MKNSQDEITEPHLELFVLGTDTWPSQLVN